MKIPYFCCIGAELKRYEKDFDFMNQVYLYKVPTDDSIEEVLSEDYFKPISDSVLQDDLVYIYEANAEILHSCRFDKQNGHITAVPLASDETLTGAVTTIIHDNLTPNKLLKSDENGKVAASDLSESDLITEARLQSEITRRAVIKNSNVVQEMQSGLKAPSVEVDNSLTVNGSAEFDNAPTTNDTTTYQNATTDSLVRKEQVDEVIQDIKTSSLTFIGYVSATEPSSATYAFNTGDLWLNSATMPTSFPFPQANIKEWNGSAWVAHSQNYTPVNFDFFRNVNNKEGYYWFGGEWVVMSTDMSTTYFQLNSVSGKWEIKSNVNLPGAPTTTTANITDDSTKIATTAFVKNVLEGYVPTGGAANTSLSNLVDAGKNISNWSSNVTNCITNIPQDIKLELNNGTLTLKAGSILTDPIDGTQRTTTEDKSGTLTTNGQYIVFADRISGALQLNVNYSVARVGSGFSLPADGSTYSVFYHANDRTIYLWNNTSWVVWEVALPLGIITVSDNAIYKIDEIFNGFGYIGSSWFLLPKLTGFIPDGFNADGTLKNIKAVVNNLNIETMIGGPDQKKIILGISSTGIINAAGVYKYIESENINTDQNIRWNCVAIAKYDNTNGKISRAVLKKTFHADDYNDSVHKTGAETIDGVKTFTDTIIKTNTVLAKKNVDNSYMEFYGGTNYNKGAYFRANGKDFAEAPGSFICCANDGVTFRNLTGYINGELWWDDQRVLTSGSAYGYPNYSAVVQIQSGWTATSNGIVFGGATYGDNMNARIVVNGHIVFYVTTAHSGNSYGNAVVSKGDVITVQGGTYYFAPMK